MKQFLPIALLLTPFFVFAQTIKEYKATNGITYHLNDTIKLGKGSNANGSFLYIEDRGLNFPGPPGGRGQSGHNLPKEFANGGVILKIITKMSINGVDKYMFSVNPGGLFRYSMFIDDAILACEVQPCGQTVKQVNSVADEIKKLKALLDSGAITKAEYEAQKKKLLNQ